MQIELKLVNIKAEDLGKVKIEIPDIKLSDFELAQGMRVYETNIHQGTKSAKTRGEVVYSKRKPWRQKGTGRARAGTRGSPIWVGGGVAHAPKPYQKRLSFNKKQKTRLFTYLLAENLRNKQVYILDINDITELKTKQAKDFMRKIGLLPFKTFYVPVVEDTITPLGFRNLKNVIIRRAQLLNPRDLFRGLNMVITKPGLEIIKSRIVNNE